MDGSTLITALIQGLVGCAIVFFILSFLRKKQKDVVQYEIKTLEAKLSHLRLILKAKVKKKSQFFRATLPTQVKQGDPFDLAATELAELPFNTNEEFEKYFSLSKQLNTVLKIDLQKTQSVQLAQVEAAPKKVDSVVVTPVAITAHIETPSEFMTADLKNEFTIIKIINEVINLTLVIKAKIETYNQTHPKNRLPEMPAIQFPSMVEIKKIFSLKKDVVDVEKIAV